MAKCKYSMKELVERKAVLSVYDESVSDTVDAKVLAVKFPGVEVQIGRKKAVIAAVAINWLKVSFPEAAKTRRTKAGAGR